MRLTLRTLLAYVDGVLEPQASEELDLKISESELAQELVERIIFLEKDPPLRRRAGDGEHGFDPNEVAAYLDNVLPRDRTIALEQLAIESDAVLGEVSSCHKIAARLVLDSTHAPQDLLRKAYATERGAANPPSKNEHPRSKPLRPDAIHEAPAGASALETKAASARRPEETIDDGTSRRSGKRVFVSHSSHDRQFVERELLGILKGAGATPWYSPDDIRTGTSWERSIIQALRDCDWFLLVMSRRSAESEWVRDEVHWAINHRFGAIIPIVVEECDPYEFHIRLDRIQAISFATDPTEAVRRLLAILSENGRRREQ